MTVRRGSGPRIPNRQTTPSLRGDLGTSATSEGPNRVSGTSNVGVEGLDYVDIPPPSARHATPSNWTAEKIGTYLAFALAALSVIFFFWHMDSNIDAIKSDVKEEKDKIDKLDEKSNRHTSSLENVTNSVQRLEGEIRRTQDYINNRKK